ncbi:MAG: hypothetical protein FWD94_02735 [Treponema sp.]|nr:hypothetical protein [Treponema sp.]
MRKMLLAILAPVLFAACASPWPNYYTGFGHEDGRKALVRIAEGKAILTVNAHVLRDVYWGDPRTREPFDEKDQFFRPERKPETKLSAFPQARKKPFKQYLPKRLSFTSSPRTGKT